MAKNHAPLSFRKDAVQFPNARLTTRPGSVARSLDIEKWNRPRAAAVIRRDEEGETCDRPGKHTKAFRTMLLRRGSLRGRRRIQLCHELPLRELPPHHRFGLQADGWNRTGQARSHQGQRKSSDLRRRDRSRRALQELWLVALFGRSRWSLRPRRVGDSDRRIHRSVLPHTFSSARKRRGSPLPTACRNIRST